MRDESVLPRRLIVTADDMGLRSNWDEAIRRAHAHGVVTTTSIVTTGSRYRQAARALSGDEIDHGVHLDLLDGVPLSRAGEIRSLVDRRGRFRSLRDLLLRFVLGRVSAAEVELEWGRQIERALGDGLRPTHLNGHYHLHLLPGLFRVAARLAIRSGIGWIRVPDQSPWFASRTSGAGAKRLLKTTVLWTLSRAQRARAGHAALGHVDCVTAAATERAWRSTLRGIRGAVTELFCHPGQSPFETEALTSPELRRAIDRCFRRTSFRELHGPS
jgi:predicted glycoside hydrolase/deacetylase ChbG (UPF0249 family)